MPPQQRNRPRDIQASPVQSIFAGAIAGSVETTVTYPADFAKTRLQLNRRLPTGQKLPWPSFGRAWYAGYTTMVWGNTLKTGIQFTAFSTYKKILADSEGNTSGPRTLVAGMMAGVTESALAVTPFESIKTTLIDDKRSARPRMNGFLHGIMIIAKERGISGFFQGFIPTTARQAGNATTKFGSYTQLKHMAQSRLKPGEELSTPSIFGIGFLTGLITVYTTQPLDVIKTRMQSIEAKREYGNVITCAIRIFKHEGIATFWSGASARMVRLAVSGGIMFSIYEKVLELIEDVPMELPTVQRPRALATA